MPRDNFTEEVKRRLADRVNHICSNPACGATTRGPNLNPSRATNIGIACHIDAAAAGGPRFDPDQTPEERSSIDNGLWLCATCADKIDADPDRHSAHTLREWKLAAELRAHRALGVPGALTTPSNVDRLNAIPVGTQVRLVYATLGGGGYVNDKFVIRVESVDPMANVFHFTSLSGGAPHGEVDSMPLGDVEEVWLQDGTWRVRTSGYMDHMALAGHRYKSRVEGA